MKTTNRDKEEKVKYKYIFPNILANVMSKVDMRTQLEASMLSMTLICIGMVISIIYMMLYLSFPLWFKIVLVVNGLCGIMFMSSYLITAFNQYQSYMEALEFQKMMQNDLNIERGLKKNG